MKLFLVCGQPNPNESMRKRIPTHTYTSNTHSMGDASAVHQKVLMRKKNRNVICFEKVTEFLQMEILHKEYLKLRECFHCCCCEINILKRITGF